MEYTFDNKIERMKKLSLLFSLRDHKQLNPIVCCFLHFLRYHMSLKITYENI